MKKPDLSAGKAAILGAGVGAMVTGAGSPLIPMAVGAVAAGAAQAVANRKEARRAHSALNQAQFKTQANYAKDL
jgi:CHASE2 domain-containing sensor protein